MNQRTTLEIIAPTVEEAIAQGLAELGLTADAVSVEVLDAGTKGFFGLGKTQVRVRLTVNPAPGEIAVQPQPAPVSKAKAERVEKKPEPTPVQPPPVVRDVESQPEHDALLDRTESVVS
ncbi:MAG TPA: Jag N-terminal domain-containing protein, partial [Anaerolineales bacterium]|nr:Jag N-terminal domain-containing protein [Anaerolineales bacterium]